MADKKSIVTLNVGSQRVSLARFARAKGGGLVLQDYAFTELSGDPAADAARLPQVGVAVNELVERLGVSKQEARFAISGHSVFTRFVKLPPLDEEKVDELVRFEAQQNVPFPINEVAWDYQLVPTGSDDGEVEVVLVAIKNDSLDELTEVVEDGGLTATAVDVAPMALYNAFRSNYSDAEGCSLLIDVGARTTNLLYIEGDRVFTRSIPVGGAAATSAIAGEFDMSFADAEERKKQDGFVSLGGSYADHEDPGIAAMSKVIRNTMTRLHGETVRTTSAYRQQGGSAPTVAYLCGGSASMPYLREFLNEKLNIEVEYFNALRSVGVGGKVDSETAGADAHNLGELVGLALRDAGSCPMEIDLVPSVVEQRRDVAARKPFLITAAVCLLGALLAGGLHFNRANAHVKNRLAVLKDRESTLGGFASQIAAEDKKEEEIRQRGAPLATAIQGRTRWVEVLNNLNAKLVTDKMWFTQVEPLASGTSLKQAENLTDDNIADRFDDDKELAKTPDQNLITHLRLYGLFRGQLDNVYEFEAELKKDTSMFKLPANSDYENVKVMKMPEGDEFAGLFKYTLELAEPIRVDSAKF